MLEPAILEKPVIFGPHTFNFGEVVEKLLSKQAAIVVHNREELKKALARLLSNEAERKELGSKARLAVLSLRGATLRTLRAIEELLFIPGA